MDILYNINHNKVWHSFLNHKLEKNAFLFKDKNNLQNFIEKEGYKEKAAKLNNKEYCFSLPQKVFINKMGSNKKRVVYSFLPDENYILKLIAFLLHKYDYLFSPNLYSFKQNYSVKSAFNNLTKIKNCYAYKVDIKNYFNSIDTTILLSKLNSVIDDEKLLWFFEKLLTQKKCLINDTVVSEETGAMAGVPLASFFANVYLMELDDYFYKRNIGYARYSDDIIVFAETEEKLLEYRNILLEFLAKNKLEINKEKEVFYSLSDKWEFLGISSDGAVIDLSKASIRKIKGKIRRKCRALYRWKIKNNIPTETVVKTAVKIFNKKFYDVVHSNELSWSRWFFPVITTSESLKIVDQYFQENLRYIASGKHTKKNYKNLDYETLKKLGYIPLVSAYWSFREKSK